MMDETRHIVLRPRLAAAADMLKGASVLADIGCDHGRLCCALAQRNEGLRCIAADISPASVQKTQALAALVGVSERVDTRLGDGLSVLETGEADALAVCGMGGALIAELLDACRAPLMGARLAVFQPMRGVEELRRYLYERGYFIHSDRVVRDAGRFYQVFSAVPPTGGERQPMSAGFPRDCFALGFTAFAARDPLLPALAGQMLLQHEKRLKTAVGTRGEALLQKRAADMRMILKGCVEPCI